MVDVVMRHVVMGNVVMRDAVMEDVADHLRNTVLAQSSVNYPIVTCSKPTTKPLLLQKLNVTTRFKEGRGGLFTFPITHQHQLS